MESELIPLQLSKILQSHSYTTFILEGKAKLFAIHTAPRVGENLRLELADREKPRPSSCDIIHSICVGLSIQVLQVVITDVQDTLYHSRLFLEQETRGMRTILEIDARPSDCLTLALTHDAPIYCTKEALEKTLPIEE